MSLHLDPRIIGSKINRNDLLLTSTGKGHDFSNGYYFPPSLYRRSLPDKLPPGITDQLDRVTWNNEVLTNYETTNGHYHNRKSFGRKPYAYPIHKQAASCDYVHYLKDVYEKLQATDSRRAPLSMGYQLSETHQQHSQKDPTAYTVRDPFSVQPYNFSQHHIGGPSQQVIASTQNPARRGKVSYPCDQGTFQSNNAYLTTANQTHRKFTNQELLGHPKKDCATYWECEDYPKAWGHGSKINPLIDDPKIIRKNVPMRDLPEFAGETQVPRLPKVVPNCPNKGMQTQKQDSYRWPADLGNKYNLYCAIDTPYINPIAGPKEVMTAPAMYETEYETYGSRYPITTGY